MNYSRASGRGSWGFFRLRVQGRERTHEQRAPRTARAGACHMVVVMKAGSSQKQIEHVVNLVREMGLKDHVIVGTERTVVACIGDDRFKDKSVLETVEGVEKV